MVLGRRGRGAAGFFNRRTHLTLTRTGAGRRAGYVSPKAGDYARAQASGVRCVPLLVETKQRECSLL